MSRRLRMSPLLVPVLVGVLVGGCAERVQTAEAGRKRVDTAAWAQSDAATPAFMAPGWKAGDKAAWEAQLRQRNQSQNDYVR
ncbi:MAG: hypothetical protein ABIX46_07500 [Burkholderiaceae bacterium]